MTIAEHLPWVLSAITIWMSIQAGNKRLSAWAIGLFGQVLWLVWIINGHAWGFLPLNIALWVIYIRNYMLWRRE